MTSIVDSLLNYISFINIDVNILLLIAIVIPGLVLFVLMAINVMLAVYFERKVAAFMQDRLGPMEVGIFGFKGGKKFWGGIGQIFADTVKLLTKEDIMPKNADKILMLISPFIIVTGALLTFIGIPFSDGLIVSDFNIEGKNANEYIEHVFIILNSIFTIFDLHDLFMQNQKTVSYFLNMRV